MKNDAIITKIKSTLTILKLYVNHDGGDLDFVSFSDGILTIMLKGNCVGCGGVENDYYNGIFEILKKEIPEVQELKLVEEENTNSINILPFTF